MQDQLNKIMSELKDIKDAIVGNEFNKNGIVQRLEVVENRVEKYVSKTDRRIWFERGIFIVFTTIWTIIIALI